MPVYSYLVYPRVGGKDDLIDRLNQIPECETIEATNEDLVILVTETANEKQEDLLQNRLKQVPSIQNIALVYGQELEHGLLD